MNADVLLFRHAATVVAQGPTRYIGRTEVALSEAGREQARAWRPLLAGLRVAGAFCSPQARARDTLALMLVPEHATDDAKIGQARATVTPCVLPELAEIDLGAWEGREQARVREQHPEAYAQRGHSPWNFRPPGGESYADVAARGMRALAVMSAMPVSSAAGGGREPLMCAVSHAGLFRAVLCALGHIGQDALLALPVRHMQCARLRGAGGVWRVLSADWRP